MENQTVKEGKTAAIIAYLTIFGTIVAFILNYNKKNTFTSFHIRQFLGIFLLMMINKYLIYDFFGWIIGGIVFLFLFILVVIGLVSAIQGEKKEVPVVGEYFQRWFNAI